jgi:translation initiation factor IF-2
MGAWGGQGAENGGHSCLSGGPVAQPLARPFAAPQIELELLGRARGADRPGQVGLGPPGWAGRALCGRPTSPNQPGSPSWGLPATPVALLSSLGAADQRTGAANDLTPSPPPGPLTPRPQAQGLPRPPRNKRPGERPGGRQQKVGGWPCGFGTGQPNQPTSPSWGLPAAPVASLSSLGAADQRTGAAGAWYLLAPDLPDPLSSARSPCPPTDRPQAQGLPRPPRNKRPGGRPGGLQDQVGLAEIACLHGA